MENRASKTPQRKFTNSAKVQRADKQIGPRCTNFQSCLGGAASLSFSHQPLSEHAAVESVDVSGETRGRPALRRHWASGFDFLLLYLHGLCHAKASKERAQAWWKTGHSRSGLVGTPPLHSCLPRLEAKLPVLKKSRLRTQ